MSKNKRWHVTKRDNGWAVVRVNSKRDSAHKDTQGEAEERAKEIATNAGGGEVVIHNRKNVIRDSDTIGGNDPNPPKDKKH